MLVRKIDVKIKPEGTQFRRNIKVNPAVVKALHINHHPIPE
jgi:hypothetical protein